jgi:protein gp37
MNPIGYVDRTWNPIVGCLPELPCWENCWARKRAHRLSKNPKVHNREKYQGFKPVAFPDRLRQPFAWRKAQRVATGFMGDIALQPEDMIQQVAEVCALTPRHTYLWLTKRPDLLSEKTAGWGWPRNIWLGVSVCRQVDAHRIDTLLEIPVAVRWVSVEPMLEPIEFTQLPRLNWIVAGPETGAGARPMEKTWIGRLSDRCCCTGVPFWDKRKTGWLARELPQCV